MTPVLHVSREVADALRAGLSIAPVEGLLVCPCFGQPCTSCGGRGVVPPVLPGRIAVAVDGAIIGTATAREVLPVVAMDSGTCDRTDRHVCVENNRAWLYNDDPLSLHPVAALGLSPGGWVVTIEDWAPTTDRCPNPSCAAGSVHAVTEHEQMWPDMRGWGGVPLMACPVCGCGESCPPVPVAAAPVGTITTWEAE